MCAQAQRYCDRLNALLGDGQSCGEYWGGYRYGVAEYGYFFCPGDYVSDVKRGGSTARIQSDGDVLDIPPRSSVPYLFFASFLMLLLTFPIKLCFFFRFYWVLLFSARWLAAFTCRRGI